MLDLVACRYGWHDDQILDLPFGRFMTAVKAARESELEVWRRAAFIGWQSACSSGATNKPFGEYLQSVGLGSSGRASKSVDAAAAIERAKAIAMADKNGRA